MRKTLIIISFVFVFAAMIAFGCKCAAVNENKETVLKGEYTIELYSDYNLQSDGGLNEWSSSDENVVFVDKNGMIIGLREGAAEIYTDGLKSGKYIINVVDKGARPRLVVNEKKVYCGDKGVIETELYFEGKSYNDFTCSFGTDSDIVTIDKQTGEFTAIKEGSADIYVLAEWRGVSQEFLAKKVNVQVVNERRAILSAARSDVFIYAVDKVGDVEFKNSDEVEIILTTKQGITDYSEEEIEISPKYPAGISAVMSGGKLVIKGDKVGENELKIKYTSKVDSSISDEVVVNVTTMLAVVDLTNDGKEYQANTNIKLNTIELSEAITDIIDDYNTITDKTQGDKIVYSQDTISWENYTFGSKKWLIANDRYGYEFTVKAYSLNVNNEDDFLNMFDYLTSSESADGFYSYAGYVVLNSNLNFSSYKGYKSSAYAGKSNLAYKKGFGWTAYSKEFAEKTQSDISTYRGKVQNLENYDNGFIGTIDGQGYTVKGLVIGQLGMFPSVGESGKICNIAFADTRMAMEGYGFGVTVYGKLDNILMDVVDYPENNSGAAGLACVFGGTLTNSFVRYECTQPLNGTSSDPAAECFGVIALKNDKKHLQNVSKSYAICAEEGSVGTYGATNVYYSFKGITNFRNGISAAETCVKDFSGFDKDIWDFDTYEIPVFKTYNGNNIKLK